MTVSTRYTHTGFVLARATTVPGDLDLPAHLDTIEQEGRAWLAKVWGRPEFQDAVLLASPDLAARVDQILDESADPQPLKVLRSAVVSLASYLLRWQRRATPFGLFAGVTAAGVGPAAVKFGNRHRAIARADGGWLTGLIDRFERHTELLGQLTVIVENALVIRDGRVRVQRRAEAEALTAGLPQESSVRLTGPVRFVLETAGVPIRFGALIGLLVTRFPSAPVNKIDSLVRGLVEAGVLVTNLRPPMTCPDGLSYLIGELHSSTVNLPPDIAAGLRQLEEIHSGLSWHNHVDDIEHARANRAVLNAQMSGLVPEAKHSLAIDTLLDAKITIPEQVLIEVARAATVLLRTTTRPFGSSAWLDYHARFRTRYGPGTLVPVRELVADSGLGYPAGYLGASRPRPTWRVLTDRDAALGAMIQQAIMAGADEIELTDADVEALTVGEHQEAVLPQRIELGVEIDAESTEALDRGRYLLRVSATPLAHTSMVGRFAHLLTEPDQRLLRATYSAEQSEDVVEAHLSFPSRRPRNENVARVAPVHPDVVSLSEHPVAGAIGIDDLAVTCDAEQLYLVQRSTGRRVVPQIPHALETTVQTPPLARFIAEVASARSAAFRAFDLGAARALPYVPRIRYRHTVLSAARWLVNPADLAPRRRCALPEWRDRWRVPSRVVMVSSGARLPLDLDLELDRSLLFARLDRGERLELQEDGSADCQGWIGRPAEFLIPLTLLAPQPQRLPITAAPGRLERPGDSDIVHAQIIGDPARFDDILTGHVPSLAESLRQENLVESWWVRRYRDLIHPDSDQHLALFLQLTSPQHFGAVAAHLATFTAGLETDGLPAQISFAATPQHRARYGDGEAHSAARRVFATDTAAAIAQQAVTRSAGISAQALAATSMAHLAAAFAPDPRSGYLALLDCLPRAYGPLERGLREQALSLTASSLQAVPGGEAVADAWQARDESLRHYYQALIEQQHPPNAVLRTLLHEHHMRAVGIDPDLEAVTGRLARAVAQRSLAVAGA
ncbi:lantibiotic dehydratase [Pseudonocardiaceae bacterium YIM PH 21723]|nr:lantibiotic dehydratase [Pseudonocardiaceae bacterium YIM PH 21723]